MGQTASHKALPEPLVMGVGAVAGIDIVPALDQTGSGAKVEVD
jgi:hypothetical protein